MKVSTIVPNQMNCLMKETNTLAVRVYDLGGVGGIYAGPVGIMSQTDYARFWEIKKKEKKGWLGRLLDGEWE